MSTVLAVKQLAALGVSVTAIISPISYVAIALTALVAGIGAFIYMTGRARDKTDDLAASIEYLGEQTERATEIRRLADRIDELTEKAVKSDSEL